MDVFFTREAELDRDLLRLSGFGVGTWGLLFGHVRMGRTYVERLFPIGPEQSGDPGELFERFKAVTGLTAVGLFVQGASTELSRKALGPAFCGRLYVEIGPDGPGEKMNCGLVDFDGRFFLAPVRTFSDRGDR